MRLSPFGDARKKGERPHVRAFQGILTGAQESETAREDKLKERQIILFESREQRGLKHAAHACEFCFPLRAQMRSEKHMFSGSAPGKFS